MNARDIWNRRLERRDMLEIKAQRRRRWPRVLASIILVSLIAFGGYILLTILSPSIPVLSGRQTGETEQKLTKPPGSFGDRLYLPQINVDVEIIGGNDSAALEKGAWHRNSKNGDPIKGGN